MKIDVVLNHLYVGIMVFAIAFLIFYFSGGREFLHRNALDLTGEYTPPEGTGERIVIINPENKSICANGNEIPSNSEVSIKGNIYEDEINVTWESCK